MSILDGNSKELNTFGDHMALLFPLSQVRRVSLSPEPKEAAELTALAKEADVVVIGSENANEFPRYLQLINELAALRPTIVVSLRFAYEATAIDPGAMVLGAFTFINPAMEAVADVLSGKLSPVGEILIRLNKDPVS